MFRISSLALGLLMVFAATQPGVCGPIVLFSDLPTTSNNASYLSDYQWITTSQQADAFTIGTPAAIDEVTVYGTYLSGLPTDDFTLRFFNDSSGLPGSALAEFQMTDFTSVSRTATGLSDNNGLDVYSYTFALPSEFGVAAGDTYYLSVVNDTALANSWSWYSSVATTTSGDRWRRLGDGGAWSAFTGDLSFEITGRYVPEPSSMTLLGVGMLSGIAMIRRRRKSAAGELADATDRR